MSIVSQNIKYLRRTNGLTQEQFSRRIGIKRSLVGAYEEARANPPLDKLKLIANCFNVSVDNLIKQDIRKLRETPDLMSNFEEQRSHSTTTSREIANDFLNRLQPPSQIPVPKPSVFPSNPIGVASQNLDLKTPKSEDIPRYEEKKVNPILPNYSNVVSKVEGMFFVKKGIQNAYITYSNSSEFLNQLERISLPGFSFANFRAFESGDDFPLENCIILGKKIDSWQEIQDGKHCILVTQSNGVLYRRVYNQVQIKGKLLVSSDIRAFSSFEIATNDVREIWEACGFISHKLPQPTLSIERIDALLDEMKQEFNRVKSNRN